MSREATWTLIDISPLSDSRTYTDLYLDPRDYDEHGFCKGEEAPDACISNPSPGWVDAIEVVSGHEFVEAPSPVLDGRRCRSILSFLSETAQEANW